MEDIQVLPGTAFKESMQLYLNLLVERDSNHNMYKTIEFEKRWKSNKYVHSPPTNL
jgi:hypothetical protein